jgi:hypothetical protein
VSKSYIGLTKIKKKKVKDVKVNVSQRPALLPYKVKDPTINYSSRSSPYRGRPDFDPPEYNLAEIGRIADTDSYVARSFDKKLSLMLKEGWSFVGKNPQTVKYIKTRFSQIAEATEIPTKELIRKLGDGLIRKSNSFIVKVRDVKASSGKVRRLVGSKKILKPVAGYFVPPAETMESRMNGNQVDMWRQRMPTGALKNFSAIDVSHFYYNKKDGFIFGTPTITPAVDDVRALRKIEENIELLVYQHLFPLFQWKVGTKDAPAGTTEEGLREVDVVRTEIQYLPTEGGIVTTERHEIAAIGAEGRALRAEGYLDHFKKRVFSGLDMSPIDFGESESSNRSTAEQLSQNLIDRVKDFQREIEGFIDKYLIRELLLESTFNFDLFDEENIVEFRFKEIDLELQIKKENHYADLFAKNTLGINEARLGMGRDVILLPTPDEIDNGQDGPDKFPEWYQLYWPLIDRPKALIQAVDEPWSNQAKARAAVEKGKADELAVKKQQVAKPAAKSVKNTFLRDAFLTKRYKDTKSQISDYISERKEVNVEYLNQLIKAALTPAVDKLNREQILSFTKGYRVFAPTKGSTFIEAVSLARSRLKDRTQLYINKLIRDIANALRRNIDVEKDIVSTVETVFDSFKFRTEFIEDVEIRKAYSYGKAISMKFNGIEKTIVEGVGESCEICNQHIGEILQTKYITIGDVAPFHSYCDCVMKSYFGEGKIEDSVQDRKKPNQAAKIMCEERMFRVLKREHPDLDSETVRALAKAVCRGKM